MRNCARVTERGEEAWWHLIITQARPTSQTGAVSRGAPVGGQPLREGFPPFDRREGLPPTKDGYAGEGVARERMPYGAFVIISLHITNKMINGL